MANNGKKEFPINGLEQDCTSKFGREYLCYVNNCKSIKKYVKKQMNRRFRRESKNDWARHCGDFLDKW